jgi:hypothetical protein
MRFLSKISPFFDIVLIKKKIFITLNNVKKI